MSLKISRALFTPALAAECHIRGKFNPYAPPAELNAFALTANCAYIPLAVGLSKVEPKQTAIVPVAPQWTFDAIKFPFKIDRDQQIVFNEATTILQKWRTVLLSLYCGFGKTMMGIRLASQFGQKTAVLVHREILKEQWMESIKKFSNAKAIIVETSAVPKPEDADIFIFNIAMVPKMWDKAKRAWVPKKLGVFKWIDLLIVDEAHIACAEEMAKALYYFTPTFAIALTATPKRPDGMDRLLELYFGEYTNTQIVRIASSQFDIYKIDTGVIPPMKMTAAGVRDWNAVLSALMTDETRNGLILKLVHTALKNPENTILILAKRVAHCKLLAAQIAGSTVMVGTQKTYNKTARVLLSTYSKLGVGFDDSRLNVLILAAPIAGQLEQYAGRLREQPGKNRSVYDLVDADHNCKKQWSQRKRWYVSRNGRITTPDCDAEQEPDNLTQPTYIRLSGVRQPENLGK